MQSIWSTSDYYRNRPYYIFLVNHVIVYRICDTLCHQHRYKSVLLVNILSFFLNCCTETLCKAEHLGLEVELSRDILDYEPIKELTSARCWG
jgi:hypothetical protein